VLLASVELSALVCEVVVEAGVEERERERASGSAVFIVCRGAQEQGYEAVQLASGGQA
jgi:hypothetical protein